jgi:hypothetical protein
MQYPFLLLQHLYETLTTTSEIFATIETYVCNIGGLAILRWMLWFLDHSILRQSRGLGCFLSYARDYIFFFHPATRFILHLLAGLETTVCTMHLAVHVLLLLYGVVTASNLSLNASAQLWWSHRQSHRNWHLSVYTSPTKISQIFLLSSLHPIGEPHLAESEIRWLVTLVGSYPCRLVGQLNWSACFFTTQVTS